MLFCHLRKPQRYGTCLTKRFILHRFGRQHVNSPHSFPPKPVNGLAGWRLFLGAAINIEYRKGRTKQIWVLEEKEWHHNLPRCQKTSYLVYFSQGLRYVAPLASYCAPLGLWELMTTKINLCLCIFIPKLIPNHLSLITYPFPFPFLTDDFYLAPRFTTIHEITPTIHEYFSFIGRGLFTFHKLIVSEIAPFLTLKKQLL